MASDKMENGKLDVMGINIDISQVLGTKIVDQYLAQLSEKDINRIMKYISQDLFRKRYDGQNIIITKDDDDRRYKSGLPIGDIIKNHFNERIKELLLQKVEEIIASEDYQKRADEIATELVEYATEGYKEDMKNRLRERLVGNVLDSVPYYGDMSLSQLVHQIINSRM